MAGLQICSEGGGEACQGILIHIHLVELGFLYGVCWPQPRELRGYLERKQCGGTQGVTLQCFLL